MSRTAIAACAVLAVVLGPLAVGAPGTPPGQEFHVSTAGNAQAADGSEGRPFPTVQAALDLARPGDIVRMAPGEYAGPISTVRSGMRGRPIQITSNGAVISGSGEGRLLTISHDHIEVRGLELRDADKLVWIEGAAGVKIVGNTLATADGECLRVKANAHGNEIAGNSISGCGGTEFDLDNDRKNGEGIYIGTAPEQRVAGEPDTSSANLIRGNRISTPGECVDIKEDAFLNVVVGNTCSGGQDDDSGAISARGVLTVIANNVVESNSGAGIRLGGDDELDGVGSVVVGNRIADNRGVGIKIMRQPQAICDNSLDGNALGQVGGRFGGNEFRCEVG